VSVVVWSDRASDQLADFYVAIPREKRERLVEVVMALNERLTNGPQFIGESRGGRQRVYFFPPLCVHFSVIPHGPVLIDKISILKYWE
jgi:hypothetical protein